MKLLKLFSAIGLALAAVSSANAAPPVLPGGQLYIAFNGTEQISPAGGIVAPSGALEQNWAVGRVSTIYQGDNADPVFFGSAAVVWTPTAGVDEITFMIWGVQPALCVSSGAVCGMNGHIDLYYGSPPDAATPPVVTSRVGVNPIDGGLDDSFTGYTNGTFLARLDFNSGIDPASGLVDIIGTALPVTTGFAGFADSFADVNTSVVGLWTAQLNTNYFATNFGPRDMRLRNVYNGPAGATFDTASCGVTPLGICGAQFSDPARAFAVPEPGSLALLGLGTMTLALMRRRQRS